MRIVSYGKHLSIRLLLILSYLTVNSAFVLLMVLLLPTTGRPEPFVIMSAIPTKDGGFMNQRSGY